MIGEFAANSFKSLDDLRLQLGQVNVLIGANGSGKSNILEAIGVLGAAASGRVDDESLLRRGVRPGVPALYKASFKGQRAPDNIRFEASWAAGGKSKYAVGLYNPITDPKPAWRYKTEYLDQNNRKVLGRSPATRERLDPESGLAALRAVKLAPERAPARLLRVLRDFVIYAPTTGSLRGLAPDQHQKQPLGLSGGRLPDAVQELLHERYGSSPERADWYKEVCSDALGLIDWANMYGSAPVSSVPLSPSVPTTQTILRFRDRYMVDRRNILTGYDASEGALLVLFAAVIAAHPKVPKFVAVDNFDHGLNPRLALALMGAFTRWVLESDQKRQVILTVQNAAILDGLPLGNDAVRLFAVDRTNKGHTIARRVEVDANLLAKAREGWTLSRMWVQGLLGGVPDV